VDLREEILILSKEDKYSKSKVVGQVNKNYNDSKILNSVPLFYFKSGPYKNNKLKLTEKMALANDGHFIYLHQKGYGLFKLGTGHGGTALGTVYLHNPEYRKDEDLQMMFF